MMVQGCPTPRERRKPISFSIYLALTIISLIFIVCSLTYDGKQNLATATLVVRHIPSVQTCQTAALRPRWRQQLNAGRRRRRRISESQDQRHLPSYRRQNIAVLASMKESTLDMESIRQRIFQRLDGESSALDGVAMQYEFDQVSTAYTLAKNTTVTTRKIISADGSFYSETTRNFSGAGVVVVARYGYDAAKGTGWTDEGDGNGIRQLISDELEAICLTEWLRFSLWLLPEVKEKLEIEQKVDNNRVALRMKGGKLAATVELDESEEQQGGLPKKYSIYLQHETWRGEVFFEDVKIIISISQTVEEWKDVNIGPWLQIPRITTHSSIGGLTITSAITSLSSVPLSETLFKEPSNADERFHFIEDDENLHFDLEYLRAWSGRLYIPAKINGKDYGWWLLDSGLSRFIINADTAARLQEDKGLKLMKFSNISGFINGEMYPGYVGQAKNLSFGPLTFDDPHLFVIADAMAEPGITSNIAGYVGYELLSKALVEIDMPPRMMPLREYKSSGRKPPSFRGHIKLSPPSANTKEANAKTGISQKEWRDLTLAFKVPHVELTLSPSWWVEGDSAVLQSNGETCVVDKVVGDSIHLLVDQPIEEKEEEEGEEGGGDLEGEGKKKKAKKNKPKKKTEKVARVLRAEEANELLKPRKSTTKASKNKQVTMLLDTGMGGSEAFQINIKRAQELYGLDVKRLGRFIGQASPGPVEPGERISIENLGIGAAILTNHEAETTNAETDKLSSSCGVCGIAALADQRIIFDYTNRRFHVSSIPSTPSNDDEDKDNNES
eukprot:jgi/Bigna1/77929/fgenesh1_pg.51_\